VLTNSLAASPHPVIASRRLVQGADDPEVRTGGEPASDESKELVAVRQLGAPVVVRVCRAGKDWQAEVMALGVVRSARSLHGLHRRVRELLGADEVDYEFHTGDAELDRLVRQIRLARAAIQLHEERARKLTGQVLMLPTGGSVRDLGVLLGLSHQRIHQLMRRRSSTVDAGDAG
jgi:hypothetical protein